MINGVVVASRGVIGVAAASHVERGVVEVAAAEGLVRLRYTGPPKVRLAVEVKIRTALLEAEPRVRRVEYA